MLTPTLVELVAAFRDLNPTTCKDEELIDLKRRMGEVEVDDPGMRLVVHQFLAKDVATLSDEQLSTLQARMGVEMERLQSVEYPALHFFSGVHS